MLSDTHCHIFSYYDDDALKTIIPEAIAALNFIQDIGTKPDDFPARFAKAKRFALSVDEANPTNMLPRCFRFSLGIWPDAAFIASPEQSLAVLEENLLQARSLGLRTAVGECGLDRYWNGANATTGENRGTSDIVGEERLFEMQLRLAQKYGLPVIVHSRDAFADTLKVIDKVGYHNGVIHCYSYGVDEVKSFLDRGWYISFSGNCTFATTHIKKQKTAALVQAVPLDKMLLETDAPYLAPAPHRGETNTPLWVRYVYERIAEIRALDLDTLSGTVLENALQLFG
ncbi:MAG: TatD family hydrolase [Treponemataceae bacterium]